MVLANTFERAYRAGMQNFHRLPNYPELAFSIRHFVGITFHADNKGVEGSVNWQATPIGILNSQHPMNFRQAPYSPSNDDIL